MESPAVVFLGKDGALVAEVRRATIADVFGTHGLSAPSASQTCAGDRHKDVAARQVACYPRVEQEERSPGNCAVDRGGDSPSAGQKHLGSVDPGKGMNEVATNVFAGEAFPWKGRVNRFEVTASIEFPSQIEVVKDASDRLYDRKTGPGVLFCHAAAIIALRSRCNGDEAGPSGARAIPGRVLSQLRLCQFSVAEKVPAGVAGGWGLSWGYWMSKQACTGGY